MQVAAILRAVRKNEEWLKGVVVLFVTLNLPPPQSPPYFIRVFGKEHEYELAEHGNERKAGAYGDGADTEQGGYQVK